MNKPQAEAPKFPRVTKTLRPHQPGTLKLVRRYGDALLCVRYREDGPGRRRCTTVELVIDDGPVQRRISDRTVVPVAIRWNEHELRERAKQLGAQWDQATRTWRMPLRTAKALALQDRVRLPAPHMGMDGKVK